MGVGMPFASRLYACMVLGPSEFPGAAAETTYRKPPVVSVTEEWGLGSVVTGEPPAGFMASKLPSDLILQPERKFDSWFDTYTNFEPELTLTWCGKLPVLTLLPIGVRFPLPSTLYAWISLVPAEVTYAN
jgi:hypothetical protein